MAFPKKISDHVPPLRDQGMDYLAAAAEPGVAVQAKQITQVGAAPFSVVLEDVGMADMADDQYAVLIGGETVGAPKVDQSTITAKGFDILGGADTEVLHVMVVGRLKGQVGPA